MHLLLTLITTRAPRAEGDCPECGAASGHWPRCSRYPGVRHS